MAEQNEEAKEQQQARKGPPMLLIFLVLLVVVGGAGFGLFLFLSSPGGGGGLGGATEVASSNSSTMILEEWPAAGPIEKLTKLAPPDNNLYAEVHLKLRLSASSRKELTELTDWLEKNQAYVDDTILGVISTKNSAQTDSWEGKRNVGNEIRLKLNEGRTGARVDAVLFQKFMID